VLNIAPLVVNGKVPDARARRSPLNDMFGNRSRVFGNDPFGSLFQSSRPVRVRSQELTLTVRPIPDSMVGDVWLPAEALVVQDQWTPEEGEAQSTWQVGEPITRTIVVQAMGLTGVQLPEITLPDNAMLKVYPDQAKVDTQLIDGSLIGVREQKLALVPSAPGRVTLPEIRIPWWNIKADRQEVAVIPARTITVLQEIGKSAGTPTQAGVTNSPSQTVSGLSGEDGPGALSVDPGFPESSLIGLWQGVAGVFLLGWVITGVGWVVERRRKSKQFTNIQDGTFIESPTEKQARVAFQQACRANDPRQSCVALLKWVSTHKWEDHVPTSVGELAHRLSQERVQVALRDLDRMLYAPEEKTWDGPQFLAVVEPALQQASQKSPRRRNDLPPLYFPPSKEKMVG